MVCTFSQPEFFLFLIVVRVIFSPYNCISYDKTDFTYIWIDLNGFKIIITSGFIEDVKPTQEAIYEKLKQVV